MKNQTPQKNIYALISGLLFSGLGSYIVYRYFFEEETITNLRLILAIVMIGYGLYRLYNYFSKD